MKLHICILSFLLSSTETLLKMQHGQVTQLFMYPFVIPIPNFSIISLRKGFNFVTSAWITKK